MHRRLAQLLHLENPWMLIALFAIITLCSLPGFESPIFSDDVYQLDDGADPKNLLSIFKPDVFGYYRPAKNAIFLIAAPYHDNLWVWHSIGLLAYLLATAGVYRIAQICLQSNTAAWLATCIWALSPTCVSTVIWLSCANISLGVAMMALAFHFHEKATLQQKSWPFMVALLFYGLSLLCYESLIALPGLLFIREFLRDRIHLTRAQWLRYGFYTVVALGFLWVRSEFSAKDILGDKANAGFSSDTRPWHLIVSAPWFLWRHFYMWAFPFGTIEILGSYAWLRSASVMDLIGSWLFLGGLIATAWATMNRIPALSYGILFFIVASVPAGNFIPNFNGPIYDAYLTIPSVGLAIAVVAIVQFLWSKRADLSSKPAGRYAVISVIALILIIRIPFCGAYFAYWAKVWRDPLEMMLIVSESRDYQFQPKAILANMMMSHGIYEQAEKLAKEVIQIEPETPSAIHALGKAALMRGDLKTAEAHFRKITEFKRGIGRLKDQSYYELARILATKAEGREEALQLGRKLMQKSKSKKDRPRMAVLMTRIYYDLNQKEKAKNTIERAFEEFPQDKEILMIRDFFKQPMEPRSNTQMPSAQ